MARRIESGSIVAALMPLFLPITPPRSVAAHNDTLNGRREDTGATLAFPFRDVHARDDAIVSVSPFRMCSRSIFRSLIRPWRCSYDFRKCHFVPLPGSASPEKKTGNKKNNKTILLQVVDTRVSSLDRSLACRSQTFDGFT